MEAEGTLGDSENEVDDSRARLLYAENYPKLQILKKKHDPENVFSKWFVISPAL